MKNKQFSLAIFFVLLAAVLRLLPHAPNVAPIGALALLLGNYFPKKFAWPMIVLVMLATDFFLGFHHLMGWVYGSYVLIAVLPKAFPSKKLSSLPVYAVSASVLFYLVTNFGVWLSSTAYSPDLQGLLLSYWNALPFLRNTMIGDMVYTVSFFGLYRVLSTVSFATIFQMLGGVNRVQILAGRGE